MKITIWRLVALWVGVMLVGSGLTGGCSGKKNAEMQRGVLQVSATPPVEPTQ